MSCELTDWQEVATYGETNLRRPVDMYEELSFEVRSEEVKPEELEQRTQCFQDRRKIY